jgi:hypothetical protein
MKLFYRNVLVTLALSLALGALPFGCSQSNGGGGAGGSSGGGSGTTAGAGGAEVLSCTVADDCGWGEIRTEILGKTDCPCLYGCPFLEQNRTTIARRQAQYQALCDPHVNGQGQGCGIDDCVVPPQIDCISGMCSVTGK